MGQPRKSRKKYNTPPHPWNAERIKNENKLMTKYGLKNKKEIWKADTLVINLFSFLILSAFQGCGGVLYFFLDFLGCPIKTSPYKIEFKIKL